MILYFRKKMCIVQIAIVNNKIPPPRLLPDFGDFRTLYNEFHQAADKPEQNASKDDIVEYHDAVSRPEGDTG